MLIIMRKQILLLTLLITLTLSSGSVWAQYGIGTNTPNASAALEIESPDKGVLIPSITLTSTSTFAPITGTASTSHDGMIVWNDSSSTANDLKGVGFYYWQGGASGNWYKIATGAGIESGTVTNSSLRWDGNQWVQDDTVQSSGSGTVTLTANTTVTGTLEVSDNATITGTLDVTDNSTFGGTVEVTGNATVTGSTVASGTLTAKSTTTLEAALVDAAGNAGTAGQILSSTSTSTEWIDNYAPAAGTVTNTTLRWDGTAWVETDTFLNSGTTTATLAANTTVTGTLEVSDNATITGTLDVTNNSTFGGTVEVTGNATVTGSTVASGTFTAKTTATLEAALVDSSGNTGTNGQVLSSTGTATQWIDSNALTMATMTATGNVSSTISLLLLQPGADMTVTLPAVADVPTGYQILIRRNQGYTGSSDSITLTGNASELINGVATKPMDVGYQSVTLVSIGTGWVSID